MSTAANDTLTNIATCLGSVKLNFEDQSIPVAQIIEPKGEPDRQPREGDDDRLEQLAKSIAAVGTVLQPVMVEQLADGRFSRVFGRRRIAAVRKLGWQKIRAIVVPPLDDDIRRTIVALENMQRQDLTAPEETLAVVELAEMRAKPVASRLKHPQADIKDPKIAEMLLEDKRVLEEVIQDVAGMLAKPVVWVRDRMYLRKLDASIREMVKDGRLPLAHARELAKIAVKHSDDCIKLAKMFAAGGTKAISKTEPGRFDELREMVRKRIFALHGVPWSLGSTMEGLPACVTCQYNSVNNPGLFDHGGNASVEMRGELGTNDVVKHDHKVAKVGVCTNLACYSQKLQRAKSVVAHAAKKIAVDAIEKHSSKASTKLRESLITTGVGAKLPKFVDLEAVIEKAEEVVDRKHVSRGAAREANPEAAAKRKREQELEMQKYEAQRKLRQARRDIVDKISSQIGKVMAETPYAFAMYCMLEHSKLVQACLHPQEKKRERALQTPGMKSLLANFAKPSATGLLELEKTCGRRFGLFNTYNTEGTEFAIAVAEAMGIDVGEAPKLEDYLPKEQKQAATEDKNQTSSKPKPVKKGAAKKATKKQKGARA